MGALVGPIHLSQDYSIVNARPRQPRAVRRASPWNPSKLRLSQYQNTRLWLWRSTQACPAILNSRTRNIQATERLRICWCSSKQPKSSEVRGWLISGWSAAAAVTRRLDNEQAILTTKERLNLVEPWLRGDKELQQNGPDHDEVRPQGKSDFKLLVLIEIIPI